MSDQATIKQKQEELLEALELYNASNSVLSLLKSANAEVKQWSQDNKEIGDIYKFLWNK